MKRPRGIVIVSPGGLSRGGGIGSVTRAMSGWIGANAPGTEVFFLDPRGTHPDKQRPAAFIRAIAQLIVLRVVHRPQILHLQVSEGGSFIRKGLLLHLGRALGMKTVLHHHGARLQPFLANCNGSLRALVRWTVDRADLNLVLGKPTGSLLAQALALSLDRVAVLQNACPDPGICPATSADPHFLVPAVLSPRKGTEAFLRAFALLVKTQPKASATLAGEGDRQTYAALAAALGIADRVRFAGWLDGAEIIDLHRRSTALVLPSQDEGMPMAIIEALGSGLPVIATPVGLIPEVLSHAETALLVPPGDVPALAAAMESIATDNQLARALSANGRQLFEQSFDLDRAMARLFALYDSLLHVRNDPLLAAEPERHHEIGEH